MSRKTANLWFGLAAGIAMGVLITRNSSGKHRMPNARVWQQILTEKIGQIEAAALMARVHKRYDELVSQSGVFESKALQNHLLINILPLLALYEIWQVDNLDQETALAQIDELYERQYKTRNNGSVWLERTLSILPGGFGTFKWLLRRIMLAGFPAPGFELTFFTDTDDHFGFDIHRCFYKDVVTHFGAPELTASFCKVDHYTMEALPEQIQWSRSGTLGTGASHCDFRWQYIPEGFVPLDQIG